MEPIGSTPLPLSEHDNMVERYDLFMKKFLRRIVCGMLCLTCMIPFCSTAFAAETPHYSSSQLARIESEREELYDFLEMQLKAQDALEYIDEFSYLVDMTINHRYNLAPASNAAGRYRAPNGGFVVGADMYYQREAYFFPTEDTRAIADSLGDPKDTVKEDLIELGYDVLWDELLDAGREKSGIKQLFGEIKKLITLAKFVGILQTGYLSQMWIDVADGGTGAILNELYDKKNASTITVIWSWDDEPYIDLSIFPDDESLTVEVR